MPLKVLNMVSNSNQLPADVSPPANGSETPHRRIYPAAIPPIVTRNDFAVTVQDVVITSSIRV